LFHTAVKSEARWKQFEAEAQQSELAAASIPALPRGPTQWLSDPTVTSSSSTNTLTNNKEQRPPLKRRSMTSTTNSKLRNGILVTYDTSPSWVHWLLLVLAAVTVKCVLFPSGFTAINRSHGHRKPAA
jgi:hypothetical protein